MSYADEVKKLVKDIKSSHPERTAYLKHLFREVRSLLQADRRELKEMARELREFLAKSENIRMVDFREMIKSISARRKEVAGPKLLEQFRGEVAEMRSDVRRLLDEYRAERKRAAGYWAALAGKVAAAPEEEPKPKPKKKKKKKKKKK